MAAISRAVATLRFRGDDLDPDEITHSLGTPPDYAQRRGDVVPTKGSSGTRVVRFGMWRLNAIDTEPENLDKQVAELLTRLTPDIEVWRRLTTRYKADMFCGWFMQESNEGSEVSFETLAALGSRGIILSLDIYAPDTDA